MTEAEIRNIPNYQGFPLGNRLSRLVWTVIYWMFFRTAVYPGGRYVRVAILRLLGAQVHWQAVVYPSVRIWMPWKLTVGAKSCIGPRVNVYNPAPIVIGNKVTISQNSYLCGGGHDISDLMLPFECAPITISDFVWVSANCFVKYGVTIGEGAIVGATASVFRSIAPWTVVGGNPAKFIRKREVKESARG